MNRIQDTDSKRNRLVNRRKSLKKDHRNEASNLTKSEFRSYVHIQSIAKLPMA